LIIPQDGIANSRFAGATVPAIIQDTSTRLCLIGSKNRVRDRGVAGTIFPVVVNGPSIPKRVIGGKDRVYNLWTADAVKSVVVDGPAALVEAFVLDERRVCDGRTAFSHVVSIIVHGTPFFIRRVVGEPAVRNLGTTETVGPITEKRPPEGRGVARKADIFD
jgi:hypothetical protein